MVRHRARMRGLLLSVFVLGAAAASAEAQGQPLTLELRTGVMFPTGALADGQRGIATGSGISLGAGAGFRLSPTTTLLVGWSRHGFSCDPGTSCSPDAVVSSRGPEIGARVVLPHATRVEPWLRGGLTFQVFRYDLDGSVVDSERGVGFEVGGGADVLVTSYLALTPGLRFLRYSAGLDLQTFQAGAQSFTVSGVVLDVGARLLFP